MLLIYIEVENVLGWMNLLAIGEKPSKLGSYSIQVNCRKRKDRGFIIKV